MAYNILFALKIAETTAAYYQFVISIDEKYYFLMIF